MVAAEIFVVDDKPANVELMCSILRRAGYTRICPFTDSRVALDAAVHASPDLIVLDLHMPGVDGLGFIEEIRDRRPRAEFVPILVLTADHTREALKGALRAGANDYATKPIDHDEVLLRVHNLLTIRLFHEELKNHNLTLSSELRERAQFDDERAADRRHKIHTMRKIIERGGPHIVFQPIVELATGNTLGVEALARFGTEPRRTPDQWFADAAAVGLGTELELSAIGAALRHLDDLDPTWTLALNVSPTTIFADEFEEMIRDVELRRLAFEITEHQPIADYHALSRATGELRARGALISVDDAGAGYASFRHILKLNPDVIKLDISLTRDVDRDPVKRALAASLERFAEDIGAAITAEGIETRAELDALRDLGIYFGQGFYIAHPAPAPRRRGPASPGRVPLEIAEAASDA
jgi:EAL domain-containing protein (putative c-di-GMP-specific phosphodiesterase class I)